MQSTACCFEYIEDIWKLSNGKTQKQIVSDDNVAFILNDFPCNVHLFFDILHAIIIELPVSILYNVLAQ